MADAENSIQDNKPSAEQQKTGYRELPLEKTPEFSSAPNSPGAHPIGAFYPGYGFTTPFSADASHCPPGMSPFVSYGPQPVHSTLYSQSSVSPYGMLYPGPSYDVSIALAALAVGEARALLQSTQELRQLNSSATVPSTPSHEISRTLSPIAKDAQEEPKQETWRRRKPIAKSRSDVPSWRKDTSTPIARSITVPHSVASLTFLDTFRNTRGRGCTLKDIKGNVALVGLDQAGSRWLQKELDQAGLSGAQTIVGEVLENALLLSRDVFGNYIVQKTLEYVDQDNKDAIGRVVKGRMRRLSFDVYGCRVVQRLMEHTSTSMAVELSRELADVVLSCVVDTNASHVIQKCIRFLPSDQIAFLLKPLSGQIKQIGKHSSGCRVLQRLVEYCSWKEIRDVILDEIIDCVTDLATSEYGNYVVQHIAQHGGPRYRSKALRRIGTNFRLFSHHRYASRVVERFLITVDEGELRYMIESMFPTEDNRFVEESWVLDMMLDPFANYIVQKILEVSTRDIRSSLVEVMKVNKACLMESGYGKNVVDAAINLSLLTAADVRSSEVANETAAEDC